LSELPFEPVDDDVPAAGDMSLPLDMTAALVGEYRWIETTLYATLGAWVSDLPLAGVQVLLDAQSMRHAWHAELFADRLPVRSGVDPDELTGPSPATAALFAALDGIEVHLDAGHGHLGHPGPEHGEERGLDPAVLTHQSRGHVPRER